MPRGRPKKADTLETVSAKLPEQEIQADQEQESHAESEAGLTEQNGPETSESPGTLLGYMAESIREDIRSFMQCFGINGHQPESVYASIMGIAEQIRGEQSAAEAHAGQQEQVPAPDEQQSPIPLNVRISTLEMDGDTRALATAEYGDLTIRRIRVKEDEYGALSVAMPKYREAGGWKETCRFNSVDSRNRLTGAVLGAYEQTMAQIQAQNAAEGQESGQGMDQNESPNAAEPQQDGPVMGGMTL